jgi:hypothetical protein
MYVSNFLNNTSVKSLIFDEIRPNCKFISEVSHHSSPYKLAL